jgi:hypothetical protein
MQALTPQVAKRFRQRKTPFILAFILMFILAGAAFIVSALAALTISMPDL